MQSTRRILSLSLIFSSGPYDKAASAAGFFQYYVCFLLIVWKVVHPFTAGLALYVGQSFYIEAFYEDLRLQHKSLDRKIVAGANTHDTIVEIVKFVEDIAK